MENLYFSLLGPLEVRRAGAVIPVMAGKQRILLAALLLRAGRPVSVDELADLIWENDPPQYPQRVVWTYVGRVRSLLAGDGGPAIVTEASGYRIDAGSGELDVAGFESALAAGQAALRAGSWTEASGALSAGLALWRGEPLAGVPSQLLAAQEVPRLSEMRAQALEARIEADLRLGRHADVIAELRQLTTADPLRERLHALLMTALYRDGQQAAALQSYQAARAVLVSELGVEPAHELRQLHQRILVADPALALGSAVPDGSPAAGGMAEGQQDRSAVQGPPAVEARYSLPPESVAFTGRNGELDDILAAVRGAPDGGPVMTIQAIGGMPGVGKTALAVRAAYLLRDRFPDRQLFIDLRGHTSGDEPMSPEAALATLLADAGVDTRSLPEGLAARTSLWRDRIAGQRVLLVLDNAASSAQVMPLLPGAGDYLVLITSRRHLADLPGATTPVVLSALLGDEACLMFRRLAPRAADERDADLAELAELAGRLPLAISLLARVYGRHSSWSLADLVTETRAGLLTLTAERETVAAAFEMSWRALDSGVRHFLCLLGLQPGTAVDAFAAAALGGVPVAEAIRMLNFLQGEGLLSETGYRRFGLHDLIRRYARERAAELPPAVGELAVSRLLDYYQHTAARADALFARRIRVSPAAASGAVPVEAPELADSAQARAWARVERANLLACIDSAAVRRDDVRVVALTAGVTALLHQDGPWAEATVRHAAAAAAAGRACDRPGRADALGSLGAICRLAGDAPAAAQALAEALSLFRDLDDERGQADALTELGEMHYLTADYASAARLYAEALRLSRRVGERLGQARVLRRLGTVSGRTRDYQDAGRYLTRARLLYRDLGDRLGQAAVLGDLGQVRRDTGDWPDAIRCLEESLAIYCDLGSQLGQAFALTSLGVTRRIAGDLPGAAENLHEARAVYQQTGDRGGQAEVLNELGTLHRLLGDLVRAPDFHRQALRMARAISSPHDEACALAGLARCDMDAGDAAGAAAGLKQAGQIFEQFGAAEAADLAVELDALLALPAKLS